MPLFKNIGRGDLILSKTNVVAPGGTCEMSQADADSLPLGVVEIVESKKPEPTKPVAPKEK